MTIFLPCLLQRWSDDSSEGTAAGRTAMSTWQDVRRDVIRNLEWLLNTEAPVVLAGREPPAAVAESVLCFGVQPYSGRAQSTMDPDEIAWSIKRRIMAFESRIDRHSLDVTALNTGQRHRFNKMQFSVHGYLRADPLPLEFLVHTELDMETGRAKVTD